jgi:hypothetical protein
MYIMNTTQTTIALFLFCLLIAFAIVFRVFLLPKLPAKIVKILQVIAICCVAMAFLITEYTVFF